MDKARAWGEALVRDLADYKKGLIDWRDVDRGLLLCGPPGTGKTTFAQAVAWTCKVPFIATSYARWQRAGEGHLGHLLQQMREDFDQCIDRTPSILFIDEIEALPAPEQVSKRHRDWWTSVVAALLECLDGASSREGVVVIAACNDPKGLAPGLVRAGRLDHVIEIDLPKASDLEGIFRYHLRGELAKESLRPLSIRAVGSTGADVEKLVRVARRKARQQQRPVTLDDLFDALDGDNPPLPPEMIGRAAVHEAGHAAAAMLLDLAVSVSMSLVRRGDQAAVTVIDWRPQSVTREVIEKQITVALAGRAAEEALLGSVAAGSGGGDRSDLAHATELATKMVTTLGLSERAPLLWLKSRVAERMLVIPCELSEEVREILDRCYARARALISGHAAQVSAIALALAERRGLADEDIRGLLT